MHKLSSPQGKEVHARRSYFLQSTQAVFNTSGHAPHCARHVWVRFPPDRLRIKKQYKKCDILRMSQIFYIVFLFHILVYLCYNLGMAKTVTMQTPEELKPLQRKSIQQRDRFFYGVVQSQRRLLSRRQRALLTRPAITNSPMAGRGSLFKKFSPMWRALSSGAKIMYKDAGVPSFLTNWQLYISDNAARLRNSLPLEQPVSELWQVRTGRIVINSPATKLLLQQDHQRSYDVTRKMRGTPWKEELVKITEYFFLPLQLQIRYKTNLSAVGGVQRARYFARIWSSYQAVKIYTDLAIDFDPSTDWEYAEVELSEIKGMIISYTLYIDIFGYTGEILFDNLRCIHSGQNWVRDPRCDNVTRTFKGGFSTVAPFWQVVEQPTGANFATVYPPAL
jgi:hypothetical protein